MAADWSANEIALIIGALAALVTAVGTSTAGLIVAAKTNRKVEETGRKVDGMLDARILAALAEGNLLGRHEMHAEQVEHTAAGKEIVHADAEADAKSAAKVREIESGATQGLSNK